MKRIIATTAAALMMGTAVHAAEGGVMDTYKAEQQGDIYATNFIGMRVYATENGWNSINEDTKATQDTVGQWDDIGEVDDIILTREGKIKAVKLDVGGFLGVGEKDIAVKMDQLKLVSEEGDTNDFFLVINANAEGLENTEAYQKGEEQAGAQTSSDAQMAATDEQNAGSAGVSEEQTAAIDQDRELLPRPNMIREGYFDAGPAELTSENLEGARVYDTRDEDIGEVNHLVLNEQGEVETVVIDIGGFLGLGEHQVGVTFDELQIMRDEVGGDFRVYIDADEEALMNQPEYQEKG